jgi:hypothetical protein
VRKKSTLLALLVLSIASVMPVMAAPAGSASAGIVLQAAHAYVSADTATSGATVFAGDTIATGDAGTLQVRFGNAQAYLLPHSSATVQEGGVGFGATLTAGTVVLSSAGGEGFRLVADGATMRPASAQPTTAQVTMVNSHELTLTSQKGPLEISMDGEVKTIPEGSSYRMVVEPAAAGSPAAQNGPNSAGSNHFLLFALILVGVGVGVGLGLALVSPSKP